ncbi:MAG TPA: efflux RND transporter periplasmic adaptor subunit [Marinilabiliaceae bacterium]|nr:efflux RND transporter periplasmic adaptor subunit [Marinilabiliaceae bacterium]
MSKKRIIVIVIIAVVALLILIPLVRKKPEAIVNIKVAVPEIGNISNSISATGTVEPTEQVEVGTQVSGVIDKVFVDYNSTVKRGELLAELDKSTLQARLLQAKASLSSAENELNYQTQNYNRIKKLTESEMVSETEYESALYKLNNASTSVERLKSEVEQAEVNLSYATIYSPIDGVVLERAIEEGQTVAASFNTPTLFTIAKDLSRMQVEANVDEADIGQVLKGQRVEFSVDAYPGELFVGKIAQIRLMPVINSNVVTYTVIIDAPNPEFKLKPGLTATVTIITKEAKNVKTIAASAINYALDTSMLTGYEIKALEGSSAFPKPGTGRVWVKNGQQIVEKEVVTGITDRAKTEVISGLEVNDSVVISLGSAFSGFPKEELNSPFMPGRPPRGR